MRGEVHIADIALELERQNLLPAIIFRTSRNQCDVDAQAAANHKALRLAPPEQHALRKKIAELMARYEVDGELITSHPQYQGLTQTGVGAHHAGQLLTWRLLLEELMAEGYLRILVATGTVAAGVDFPARTVVITAHSRRGAEGYTSLTAAEFQQMSGRAGRRGRDTVGFCLAAPAPFCDARALLKISKRPPEPLRSSYFPGPSTVLNLLRYRNVDDLRFTVGRSLASFVDKKAAQELETEAAQLEAERGGADDAADVDDEENSGGKNPPAKRIGKKIRRFRKQAEELKGRQLDLLEQALAGLRNLGYLEGVSLSPKGYWAANLCTSLVLELAELIESGIFENVSAERLAAIIASIAGDEHRTYLNTKNPPLAKDDIEKISAVLRRVGETTMAGVSETRQVLPSAANTVLMWMNAETWQEFRGLLTLSGVAEGDAARLLTQTAEQLNQLTRLTETHQQLVYRAEEAKRRILRPPLTEGLNLETS